MVEIIEFNSKEGIMFGGIDALSKIEINRKPI
jgi:hypothetical protein